MAIEPSPLTDSDDFPSERNTSMASYVCGHWRVYTLITIHHHLSPLSWLGATPMMETPMSIAEFLLGISPHRLAHSGSARSASSTTSRVVVQLRGEPGTLSFEQALTIPIWDFAIKNVGSTIQIWDPTINNGGLTIRIWDCTIKFGGFTHKNKMVIEPTRMGIEPARNWI